MAKRKSIVRQGRHAETSCAACGRSLTLFDSTKSVDGNTVCASGCLGQGILTMRQHNAEAGGPWAQRPGESDEAHAARLGQPGGPDYVDPDWSPDDPPELPEAAYADEADYGGTLDALGNVSSDADPGL